MNNFTKVFAKTIEDEAIKQIETLSNSEAYNNCRIRIMPDCHAGKGCTIGTVIELDKRVVPNTVGVDIGCGMKGREIWEHDYITDFPHCGEVIFANGGFAIHSDVGDLPIERFIDKLKDSPLGTYGQCLVTNQGSNFDRKEGGK